MSGSRETNSGRLTPRQGGGDDRSWWIVAGAVYGPLCVACMAWYGWSGGLDAIVERQMGDTPVRDAALGLILGVGASGLSRTCVERGRLRRMADVLGAQLGPLSPGTTLALALASGLGEEWLFRGVILDSWGWVASVLVFAVAHASPDPALRPWPVMALVMGLVFVALAVWTNALMAPVVLHITVNALNLRWLVRRHQEQALGPRH